MASTRVPANDPTRAKTRYEQVMEKVAATRFAGWFLVTIGEKVDPWLMRVSKGRINTTGTDLVVVLTNVGARSGEVRHTPIAYFTDGDDVVLIASNAGSAKHPAWYHNVRANPDVELHVGPDGGPYRARVAEGEERERLWGLATTMYSGFDTYQSRSQGRRIEVVVCSPTSAAA